MTLLHNIFILLFFFVFLTSNRPNGKIFSVPTSSVFIPTLHVGDIVTFSYENHARRDLPVNPKIYRIRTDLDWQEVINNFKKEETFLSGIHSFLLLQFHII